MVAIERDVHVDESHPIDIAEHLAERQHWDVDRVTDDQIAFAVEGAWRTYSLSLAWHGFDETLRLICTFEMEPPEDRLPELYRLIEAANDRAWLGGFNLWRDEGLMVYRYALTLRGEASATPGQIDAVMKAAVEMSECFFPAFQLVAWGDQTSDEALSAVMSEAVGRA